MAQVNSKYISPSFFLLSIAFFSLLPFIYLKSQVIASFGKNKITLEEFRIAYLDIIKRPNVYDSKELREEFLDELITSRLFSQKVEKMGLDKNELWQAKINAYKNKCLREAHYEKVIRPKIHVTENDIEETYMFTQEERRISHLFAETKEKADSLYKLLQSGATFEQLAKTVFKDSALANSGGDLGWVYWDQLDYAMGQAAFKMPVNKISEPIKTNFGYHIIKVTDYKKNPLISRYEYEVHRRKAKYLLEFELGEKYSYEYIGNMIDNAKVVIYPEVLKFVEDKLSDKFRRKPTEMDKMFETQLREEEIKFVETNLWDERSKVIATVNGENFTINDFMGLISYIPYDIIYSGFKKTFDYALRDFLITREAKNMGLENNHNVKLKTNLYKEFLLSLEMRRQIVRGVRVDDNEVKNLYDENKVKFKGATYEQMHDILHSFVLGQKRREIIPEQVKKLLADMKVTKDLKTLNDYYDAIRNPYTTADKSMENKKRHGLD